LKHFQLLKKDQFKQDLVLQTLFEKIETLWYSNFQDEYSLQNVGPHFLTFVRTCLSAKTLFWLALLVMHEPWLQAYSQGQNK
jgi:hypothetical protein